MERKESGLFCQLTESVKMPDDQFHRDFQRTLIIDDHPLFCDALSMTLRMVMGIETVIDEPNLASAILRLEDGLEVDVILLDLNLPDVSGLDGLMRLKTVVPTVPVIIVSSITDEGVIRSALAAGASGYVPKHSHRHIFQTALKEIASGGTYLPECVLSEPDESEAQRLDALRRMHDLTRQQMRILELICEGKLNKQIAYDLSIAEATVKAHVTAIMRKLGVQSRTQAVLIAQEANFAKLLHES